MKEVLQRIERSKISTIGFGSFRYEQVVINFLKKLPNSILLADTTAKNLINHIQSQKFKRDLKLSGILGDDKVFLLVDVTGTKSEYQEMKELFYEIRQSVIENDHERYKGNSTLPEINIIFLSFLNTGTGSKPLTLSRNPMTLLVNSDLFIIFTEDLIKVEKDRIANCETYQFTPKMLQRHNRLDDILNDKE